MDTESKQPGGPRENILGVALVLIVGATSLFFLYVISLGIVGNVLSAVVFLAVIFSIHYLLWGKSFSDEVRAERERLARAESREIAKRAPELPSDAIQDLSRTHGIQEK